MGNYTISCASKYDIIQKNFLGRLAQLVRAGPLHGQGRESESLTAHQSKSHCVCDRCGICGIIQRVMNKATNLAVATFMSLFVGGALAMETINLPPVDLNGGKTVMRALKDRKSDRAFADKDLSLQELSGLLWAANGFNRPDKRTNATGMNKQTTSVYVCRRDGAYRYDAKSNVLVPVCEENLLPAFAAHQPFVNAAPLVLLIVADLSDPIYSTGSWNVMSHYDAGIVSGNIYLYCAAHDLATVCRGTMDRAVIKKALKLSDKTILHLNHPVGHFAK